MREKQESMQMRNCRRLFRSGEDLNLENSVLSKSKRYCLCGTVDRDGRLEGGWFGKIRFDKRAELRLTFFLLQNDFLKDSDIESLDMEFIKNVWAQLKDTFVLKNEN
ncbi:MAG: hypothetical protein HGA61_00550 [Candidatus Moranbacteria bacterium]|nr:hypothetical protein [Candidatus Moranbacteria bacterium]